MFEDVEPNSERWFNLRNLLNEEWKDIKDYEGLYQVSNYGRVKSLERLLYKRHVLCKILKSGKDKRQYEQVALSKNGKLKTFRVHRLVAQAFILNPENKPQINHIDCNKQNNNVNNLEWCTNGENGKHAWDNGLRTKKYGKDRYNSRGVYQLTNDFKVIAMWDSIMDIERILGFNHSDISKCCRKKSKTSHGFIWRYNNDTNWRI